MVSYTTLFVSLLNTLEVSLQDTQDVSINKTLPVLDDTQGVPLENTTDFPLNKTLNVTLNGILVVFVYDPFEVLDVLSIESFKTCKRKSILSRLHIILKFYSNVKSVRV